MSLPKRSVQEPRTHTQEKRKKEKRRETGKSSEREKTKERGRRKKEKQAARRYDRRATQRKALLIAKKSTLLHLPNTTLGCSRNRALLQNTSNLKFGGKFSSFIEFREFVAYRQTTRRETERERERNRERERERERGRLSLIYIVAAR